MEATAVYAGSFDPVTFGHLDLIERAVRIFPRLIVAVARNLEKTPFFDLETRLTLLRETTRKFPGVEVDSFSGLLVDYVRSRGAEVMIRGLRAVSDFEYEFQMALTNRKMVPSLETIFLMPAEPFTYLSSSMTREVAVLGGDISAFVPAVVAAAFREKIGGSR
ncbi:MAG TPA: pantetheine-phosphate adenylyltransferase [bacterium]|nr:pantetheine-phosphate adenylyltransferase [bacterium]HPJ71220.1 pantetheine-phosphate adenylyltransferase [bacterium]HPQ66094.1 pantetheine-phosphate adenylyltransferase [bacterium]